jgi:hypothetical protein
MVEVQLQQPQSASDGHHTFPVGHPRYGGRPKGRKNRFGGDLREAVVLAKLAFCTPPQHIISVLEGWSRCTMAIIFPNSIFSDGARTASPYLFSTSGLRFCRSAGR